MKTALFALAPLAWFAILWLSFGIGLLVVRLPRIRGHWRAR